MDMGYVQVGYLSGSEERGIPLCVARYITRGAL